MPRVKSWKEKLATARESKVVELEKPFAGLPPGTHLFVPSALAVLEAMKNLPAGTAISLVELRRHMARSARADATCPVATSFAARIVAEAALEDRAAGADPDSITPFWRGIDPSDPLASRLSCGADFLVDRRRLEAREA